MSASQSLQVTAEHVAMRLDRFLDDSLPELSRSQIKRLIDEGAVTLNGGTSKPGFKLRGGEEICVVLPDPLAATAEAEPIPLHILYEDPALVVVNKPAHLVVHPAPGHRSGTLVNALLHHCKDLSGVGGELRPGIVHRLDKDTSGVMVATKNDRTHRYLARQFKAHSIQRRYRALVHGLVAETMGTIDQPIGRHPVHRKKMSTVARSSRRAVTRWQVLRRYEADRMTLLDLSLETGRTHQIRVHMAGMNCPVVGDPLYGGASRTKAIADQKLRQMVAALQRQFLHAWQLGFEHPNGLQMVFQADVPSELQEILYYLEGKYHYSLTDLEVPLRSGPVEMIPDENS
ncbi:MAG: RluA family pseudouridine synthase [Deltaproteobacteria bacterium]|nr:RluA family pseudouridine synthase [Deltaproteobacteria bacterium]MBW2511699.1 RluA family pseudouridine synthase [Deltaproteobacteria bacterium]MDH4007871.1 RluA family pseudouridine synthase [Desulfuromonadales bacterium]